MDQQAQAERPASNELSIAEQLRIGHGILTRQQFQEGLRSGDMEVWIVGPQCYVLVTWGISRYGKTLNILTALGSMHHADECMGTIEKYARVKGAGMIISVGELGWMRVAERHGYETKTCLLMKKVL